jgi:hypothetical protein
MTAGLLSTPVTGYLKNPATECRAPCGSAHGETLAALILLVKWDSVLTLSTRKG